MTIVCIHQPDFIPWIGFFDRLLKSDIFVVLDNVQLLRRGWHNRDKIKTAKGPMWLTVPINWKGRSNQLINEAEIDNIQNWRRKQLKALDFWYKKAPYFDRYFPQIEKIYSRRHQKLVDLNVDLLNFLSQAFEIEVEVIFASSLNVTAKSTDLMVRIVKAVGGDTYLSGIGAKDYLDEQKFEQARLKVIWQKFEHPVYPQLHGEFIPDLSSIDFLFNCGDKCVNILKKASWRENNNDS
jgi:hypothetical protein